jgi:hypothetical protein
MGWIRAGSRSVSVGSKGVLTSLPDSISMAPGWNTISPFHLNGKNTHVDVSTCQHRRI